MPASKGQIKVLARITALEILVQHLLYVAFDRDAAELRAYRQRVLDEYAEATFQWHDPATADVLMQELVEALDMNLTATIERAGGRQPSRRSSRNPGLRRKS